MQSLLEDSPPVGPVCDPQMNRHREPGQESLSPGLGGVQAPPPPPLV